MEALQSGRYAIYGRGHKRIDLYGFYRVQASPFRLSKFSFWRDVGLYEHFRKAVARQWENPYRSRGGEYLPLKFLLASDLLY
jgi:Lon protease-like protein